MDEKQFIEIFATIFDEIDTSSFTLDTNFKDNEEWSSLTALGLLAVMEEEFDKTLSGKEIENSYIIRDIYNIVNS